MSGNEHMMSVILNTGANPRGFNHFIGRGVSGGYTFDPANNQFEIAKGFISQAQLDQFAIDYAADQANADAAADQAATDRDTARVKDSFDAGELRLLRAFAKLLLREINDLRGQHGLAPRTFAQFRTALRNELDTTP